MMWQFTLLGILLTCSVCQAYKYYENHIPNGVQVPDPCRPNTYWKGVGHQAFSGGGPRNPFGLDFAANNHVWDESICRKDSDGDGLTNGEELGDPNCKWTEGAAPERFIGLSHPGICEPVDSEPCKEKNAFKVCATAKKFECDDVNGSDVKTTIIQGVPTKVPPKETTYTCKLVNLPLDGDYHLIAHEPIIDNANVMHHMILYGCDDGDGSVDQFKEPMDCFQVPDFCTEGIAGWTLGEVGQCFDGPYGVRIGKHGKKKGLIQYHWTNVEKRTDYVDSSGFKLYYTTKLRRYDASSFTIGQTELTIPPQMPLVEHTAMCSSECTKKLITEPIYLVNANLHMHYLGDSGGVELFRDGKKEILLWQDTFAYDSPYYEKYNPVFELRGGDVLKITCNYKSTTRTNVTNFGWGIFDEMCYVFFIYYPKLSDSYCGQHGEYEVCYDQANRCNPSTFINSKDGTDTLLSIAMYCQPDECVEGCTEALLLMQNEIPCLRPGPDFVKFLKELYGSYDEARATDIFQRLVSCGLKPSNASVMDHRPDQYKPDHYRPDHDKPDHYMPDHYKPDKMKDPEPSGTGMTWKDQVEFLRGMRDVACGGSTICSWSIWSLLLIAALIRTI